MEKITRLNYVDQAEEVIKKLKKPMVTTSKLRNLLAITSDIYNQVVSSESDDLDENIKEQIEYLRIRFIYEIGRDEQKYYDNKLKKEIVKQGSVSEFVKGANLLNELENINGSRENYIIFSRYMEALVAFHKYYGVKEQ